MYSRVGNFYGIKFYPLYCIVHTSFKLLTIYYINQRKYSITSQADDEPRPPMDLFKAIFANDDDSDSSETEDIVSTERKAPVQTTYPNNLASFPHPLSHKQHISTGSTTNTSKPPTMSSDKHWQDLSVVSSYVELSKVELPSHSKHLITNDPHIMSSNEKPELKDKNLMTSACTFYGPSLPPGMYDVPFNIIIIIINQHRA